MLVEGLQAHPAAQHLQVPRERALQVAGRAAAAGLDGEDLLGAAGRRVGDEEHDAVTGLDHLHRAGVGTAAVGLLVQGDQ
ncbi:hypothetical protein ADK53_23240 [Streptomyces sp. WM6373]|nr:hypothetical protein ADK53_23240 [Streptomyces sp. WM6373]